MIPSSNNHHHHNNNNRRKGRRRKVKLKTGLNNGVQARKRRAAPAAHAVRRNSSRSNSAVQTRSTELRPHLSPKNCTSKNVPSFLTQSPSTLPSTTTQQDQSSARYGYRRLKQEQQEQQRVAFGPGNAHIYRRVSLQRRTARASIVLLHGPLLLLPLLLQSCCCYKAIY